MRVESSSQLLDFVHLWGRQGGNMEELEFLNLDLSSLVVLSGKDRLSHRHKPRRAVRYLRCYRCRLQPGGMRRLAASLKLSDTVRTLNLSGNSLGGVAGARELGQVLETCTTLKELYIHRNELTSEGVRLVVSDGLSPRLLTLNLQNNRIGLEGVKMVSQTSLHMLILASNGLEEADIAPIADLLASPRTCLQWLDLANNRIGNGLTALVSALERNRTLHTLMLSGNGVDDTGAALLGGLLTRNGALRTLDLACNLLSNRAVLHSLQPSVSYSNCLVSDLGLFANPHVTREVANGLHLQLKRAVLVRQLVTLRSGAEVKRLGERFALKRLPKELFRSLGHMLFRAPVLPPQEEEV